jgi:hypothetical protein
MTSLTLYIFNEWFVDICSIVCLYTCLYYYLRLLDNGSNRAETCRKLIIENKGFLPNYRAFCWLDFCEYMHCYRTEIRIFMSGWPCILNYSCIMNQHDAPFIFTLLSYHTSTCFRTICTATVSTFSILHSPFTYYNSNKAHSLLTWYGLFSLLCVLYCSVTLYYSVLLLFLCTVQFAVLVLYCVCLWCTCCYPNWGFSVLLPHL